MCEKYCHIDIFLREMCLSCALDDKIGLSNLPPVEADGFFDAIIRFKDLLGI